MIENKRKVIEKKLQVKRSVKVDSIRKKSD